MHNYNHKLGYNFFFNFNENIKKIVQSFFKKLKFIQIGEISLKLFLQISPL